MAQLLKDYIPSPDQKIFRVSTIATLAGGSEDERDCLSRTRMSDFDNYNAWPFETMVFEGESSIGLYHAPYASEAEARKGHGTIIEAHKVRLGVERRRGRPGWRSQYYSGSMEGEATGCV